MLLHTHEYLPFQCPKAMSILIHYTNSIWKEIYIYNLATLGKNFRKDKNGSKSLNNDIGRGMNKMLLSLNVQLKTR